MNAPHTASDGRTVELSGLGDTRRLAERCAALARPGDVVALAGGLGAGKTAFARAFVNAVARREGAPEEDVPSPTFTLVQVYEFPTMTVYHFDLYRIENPEEVTELGLEEALADGVTLIEWPERLGGDLSADRLALNFDFGDGESERRCTIRGHGDWVARARSLADG
jgi:tRNA threonylcarbamoyladenosine biosynthesis protein TsaE